MSVFTPGTGGSMSATTIPGALFEAARLVDAAENARNAANPGVAPKQNISVTVDFGTRTAAIAATIPMSPSLSTAGALVFTPSDYLGAPYSAFVDGGSQLTSGNVIAAFCEVAQILAAAEKAVTPVEDQPDNVTYTIDDATQSISITANLPIATAAGAAGAITVSAIDYL